MRKIYIQGPATQYKLGEKVRHLLWKLIPHTTTTQTEGSDGLAEAVISLQTRDHLREYHRFGFTLWRRNLNRKYRYQREGPLKDHDNHMSLVAGYKQVIEVEIWLGIIDFLNTSKAAQMDPLDGSNNLMKASFVQSCLYHLRNHKLWKEWSKNQPRLHFSILYFGQCQMLNFRVHTLTGQFSNTPTFQQLRTLPPSSLAQPGGNGQSHAKSKTSTILHRIFGRPRVHNTSGSVGI